MKYYISLLLLFVSIGLHAQEEKTLYIAKYQYSAVSDTNNRNNVYQENMILLIGKSSSLFKSYDQFQKDSLILKQNSLNMNVFANARQYTDDQILDVYNNPSGYLSKKIGLRYYWEIAMPKYNWQITQEFKTLAGYKCQKATMFSSRTNKTYIAWFTSEIPIPAGPSYMSGLPGLIIEFEDLNKTISMKLYSFNTRTSGNETISFGKKAVKTTLANYQKALAAYKNDPIGFLKGSGALNGDVSQQSTDDQPVKN